MLTIVWQVGGVKTYHDRESEYHNHDDMLRYDLAFCNPEKPEMVVFPIFKGRDGRTSAKITTDRWHSFGLTLDRASFNPNNAFNWITYRDPECEKKMTLKEFMVENKYTLVGWR